MSHMRLFIFTIFLIISSFLKAQDSIPGIILKGSHDYIEYMPGNMPLVISIPHGGFLLPDEIPERPCTDCAKNKDVFTIEIGFAIRNTIYQKTGFYPYIIINKLHRTRLDPNRNIAEAAAGNKNAEVAWIEFQSFIDSANASVNKKFGKGLYIDLHGHRHEIRRTELGYLLSSEELQLDDDMLNSGSFVEYSSIRNLVGNNLKSLTYSELVRGSFSLGGLLEKLGYPCVPDQGHPSPLPGEPYFSGGYNITRHGSSSGGTIDGIQIELDEELRSDIKRRDKFVADVSNILLDFLETHYFSGSKYSGSIKAPE
jgi:hypothetical protein